ncbi:MAG: TIGR04282 family arsenosugar biosynthesis glycosyltransferase [Alphaproteobacteria bacterium]|nr:TIGR04282 family arsenosugar biosynthesis glycosyltransferase [Alphaproteobacteria bacterium]
MKAARLILFLKAPRLGAVKTRLGAAIGPLAAWRFYNAMLDGLWREFRSGQRWRTVLAVSPDQGSARWPSDMMHLPQGRGDLGQRMARVMAAEAGPVVLVGGDIPDLRRHHIAGALRALKRADAVFGPADDGGFWLVGLRRGRWARRLFRGVRWSSPHALADTIANLPATARVELLETLSDIDTEADYRRYLRATRIQLNPIECG